MHLIVITGNDGVGKTTVGNYLNGTLLPGSIKFNMDDAIKKHLYDQLIDITYSDYLKLFDERIHPVVKHKSGEIHKLVTLYNLTRTSLLKKQDKEAMAKWYVDQLLSLHKLKNKILIIDDLQDEELYQHIRTLLKVPTKNAHVFMLTRKYHTGFSHGTKLIKSFTELVNNDYTLDSLHSAVRLKIRYINIIDSTWPIKIK